MRVIEPFQGSDFFIHIPRVAPAVIQIKSFQDFKICFYLIISSLLISNSHYYDNFVFSSCSILLQDALSLLKIPKTSNSFILKVGFNP